MPKFLTFVGGILLVSNLIVLVVMVVVVVGCEIGVDIGTSRQLPESRYETKRGTEPEHGLFFY